MKRGIVKTEGTLEAADPQAENSEAPQAGVPDKKATTVRLPIDLIKAAKLYAVSHDRTLTDLIEESLKTWIEMEDDLMKRAKLYAEEHGKSLAEVIKEALEISLESGED